MFSKSTRFAKENAYYGAGRTKKHRVFKVDPENFHLNASTHRPGVVSRADT